jgi:hypothetical protein
MPKRKPEPGSEFLEAMQQAADILLGKTTSARARPAPALVDLGAIRAGTRVGQKRTAQHSGCRIQILCRPHAGDEPGDFPRKKIRL